VVTQIGNNKRIEPPGGGAICHHLQTISAVEVKLTAKGAEKGIYRRKCPLCI